MKALNVVFWTAVGGIVLSLAMTIYTAVSQKAPEVDPQTIATPATLPNS